MLRRLCESPFGALGQHGDVPLQRFRVRGVPNAPTEVRTVRFVSRHYIPASTLEVLTWAKLLSPFQSEQAKSHTSTAGTHTKVTAFKNWSKIWSRIGQRFGQGLVKESKTGQRVKDWSKIWSRTGQRSGQRSGQRFGQRFGQSSLQGWNHSRTPAAPSCSRA